MLARPDNFNAFADPPGLWIVTVHDRRPPVSISVDMNTGGPRPRMIEAKSRTARGVACGGVRAPEVAPIDVFH